MSRTPPAELNLLGLNEIKTLDRWALERRVRPLAQPVYLGKERVLCRVLGRYKLYVDTSDVGFGAHVMMDGLWESWLTVFMARRIQPGMSVVDVGANHGYYTLMFADLVGPQGRVAAVEPSRAIVELLKRSVAVNGFSERVTIHECAAVSEDGVELALFTPDNEPKNARIITDSHEDHSASVSITGSRLATLLHDWPRVDFMKIDVEGAEEAALAGAWPILERDLPDVLLEFSAVRCADPEGLLERLEALYGQYRTVTFESTLVPITKAELLDRSHTEDWILYLSRH